MLEHAIFRSYFIAGQIVFLLKVQAEPLTVQSINMVAHYFPL
jgi:hypothetical protein